MWKWRKRIIRKKRGSSVTKHYVEHKELARELVLARLDFYNQYYQFKWNRVAIRNQRRCWGSCTSLKNLNFNYKIQFLPPHLQDYIIVHELCHLRELNHGVNFWKLVAETVPNYRECMAEVKLIDKRGHSVDNLLKIQASYMTGVIKPLESVSRGETIAQDWCESCDNKATCNCKVAQTLYSNQ